MSTKVTIAYSDDPDFHLYYDFSDDNIHLDLNDEVEFRAWPNGYNVVIPKAVLKAIIKEIQDPNSNYKDFFNDTDLFDDNDGLPT